MIFFKMEMAWKASCSYAPFFSQVLWPRLGLWEKTKSFYDPMGYSEVVPPCRALNYLNIKVTIKNIPLICPMGSDTGFSFTQRLILNSTVVAHWEMNISSYLWGHWSNWGFCWSLGHPHSK